MAFTSRLYTLSAWVRSIQESSNSTPTVPSVQEILSNFIDYFIPGYGVISHHISKIFGLDINWIWGICLAFCVFKWLVDVFLTSFNPMLKAFTAQCDFTGSTVLYRGFTSWSEGRGIGLNKRLVRAGVKQVEIDFEEILSNFDPIGGASVRQPPWEFSLKSAYGAHWFLHKDALCHDHHLKQFKTYIFGPNDRGEWQEVAKRASRSIMSVVLNEATKSKLVLDVVDYPNNSNRRWYRDKGLSYRRGYLFYGPPGTGKSSLSFALAGMLDMEIYSISLQGPSINDKSLFDLFKTLPSGCIVLTEDIDSAGIQDRRNSLCESQPSDPASLPQSTSKNPDRNSKVALAGLLNVIDGVASKEGRILIMTTNKVSALDPALIRPGRIDMTIEFELLSREDTHNLFILMYKPSETEIAKSGIPDTLKEAAIKFAACIPEGNFSPAEVQGYLICHKNSPEAALAEVTSWVNALLFKKKKHEIATEE